ncbi:MAG: hypothetical protein Q9170_005312 [Blastenia crenularia]
MSGQVDLYYWEQDNLTDLCTDSCIGSASNWLQGVYDACSGQTMNIASKMVPTESVAIRYSDGIGLACLTDLQLPIMLSFNQTPDAAPSTTDTPAPTTQTVTTPPGATTSSTGTTVQSQNSTFNYCFLEAQNWVGVDIDTPDCSSDPNNYLCTNPDAATRIANLYNDTILCSDCFLSVMWWRINSPFLPDTDESDDLIAQFQDITDVCNRTMPLTVIRAPPTYPAAPPPVTLPPGTDPNANSTDTSVTSCAGQTISSGSSKRDELQVEKRDPELMEFEDDHSGYARVKRAAAGSCDSLSQTYGVTTGDLQTITGNDNCSSTTSPICVPLKCAVTQVGNNQSCDAIVASLSTASINVTTALFLQWNPNIIGLCDSLAVGQYICTGPPGGGYTLPPPISGTNTDAGGQERGGQGTGTNPDGPDGPAGPSANSTNSAPTQANITKECNAYAYAKAGDTCYDLSQRFHITLAELTTWNPVLGYPDGHNCTTQFWEGYDYCVGVPGNEPTSTSSQGPPTSTTKLPYPTQSGIAPQCNKYAEAQSGDYCYKFAQDNNITTDQLYSWNNILGPNGADCSTQFQAGYDYCVGVSTGPTATTTTSSSSPLPTQSGLAQNCITTAQLYTWNPVLGANGENCNLQFQAGEGYCVGGQPVSPDSALIRSLAHLTPDTNKITIPSPSANSSLTSRSPIAVPDMGRLIPRLFFDEQKRWTPRGGQLIMSLTTSLWLDTGDRPFLARFSERRFPFRNYLYVTLPAARAGLTPHKIAVTYVWLLMKVFAEHEWPGEIVAEIWEGERRVGSIDIVNVPVSGRRGCRRGC